MKIRTGKAANKSWLASQKVLKRSFLIGVLGIILCAGAAQAQTITRTSSWTYDPNTGLMTSETVEPTGPSTMTTTYTYDAYGNKTAVTVTGTNVAARTTTTTYDSRGEFVTEITNALSQSELWTYDPRFGVPLSHIGPNEVAACSSNSGAPCLQTTWSYDSLGRKIQEVRPDGTDTVWNFCGYVNGTDQCPANFSFGVGEVSYGAGQQSSPATQVFYDALGRVVHKTQQAFSGNTATWVYVETSYNNFGQVSQTSAPYFAGGTPVWTTYTYDPLGRTLTVSSPDTSGPNGAGQLLQDVTSYQYEGLTTIVTDPLGHQTTTTNNDLGLPAVVTDANGTQTQYAYDAVGDLVTVADQAGNVTYYTYDTRGRKVFMTDPDRGQWSYIYDGLSELTNSEDADADLITITYDALGRMKNRVTRKSGNINPQTDTWVYDTAANGIGKLAESESCASNTTSCFTVSASKQISKRVFSYDTQNRPIATANQAASTGPVYTTSETYDSSSRIATVTYPSGYFVSYRYSNPNSSDGNQIGSLYALLDPSGNNLWTLTASNALGQATQITLGNGIVINNTYDSQSSRLLTIYDALPNTAPAAYIGYYYDQDGDITTRSDASVANNNVTDTLTYDALNRLTQDSVTDNGTPVTNGTKTITYDMLGDITSKSDVGAYAYNNTFHVHAVSKITGKKGYAPYNLTTSYTYDSNGNTLTGDGYVNTWTPFNMISVVNPNGGAGPAESYTYDAEHNRVTQSGADGVTQYLSDPNSGAYSEAVTNSAGQTTIKDYLTAGGNMFAVHTTPPASSGIAASINYLLHDALDSVVAVTDVNGNVLEYDSYDAWGKRRQLNGTDDVNSTVTSGNRRGYTNQEQVPGMTLLNYNARMYDPLVGRFLSPDPEVSDTYNLQALNPYSYVLNNPMSANDPTGMKCHGGFWHGCISFHDVLDIVSIAVAVVAPYALAYEFGEVTTFGTLATSWEGALNAAIAGGAAGAISSEGNINSALIGAFSAGAFYGVGSLTDGGAASSFGKALVGAGVSNTEAAVGDYAAQVAGDGLVGGLSSVASGGGFGSGFLAAGFSSAVGQVTRQYGYDGLVASAVTGGVASEIGGGSFANGAETGAFSYLFNRGLPGGLKPYGSRPGCITCAILFGSAALTLFQPEVGVPADILEIGDAAEGTAARGLGNLGGIFSSSENAAGGTVYLSDGAINQNQVADIVGSEIYNPGEINIISGVHGTLEGGTEIDTQMFNEDVARFGNIPGVNVFNYSEMSSGQINELLNGPGTTIGAFCFSCAVLKP